MRQAWDRERRSKAVEAATIATTSQLSLLLSSMGEATSLGREIAYDVNDAGKVLGYGGDGQAVMWLPPQ